MEYLQLEYFVQTARTCNITQASEKLCVSQPALSQMIKKLELELEVKLFIRNHRGLTLTDEGRHFLRFAEKALQERNDIIQQLHDASGKVSGKITIQANAIGYLIAQLFCGFRAEYPDVEVQFLSVPELSQNDYSKSPFQSVDLFVTTCPPYPNSEAQCLLTNESLLAVLPHTHPLVNRDSLSLKELKEEPFLLYEGGEVERLIRQCCYNSGFSPKVQLKCHTIDVLFNMVHANFGVSLFPSSWKQLCSEDICFLPLQESYSRPIYLCWDEKKYRNHATKLFQSYVIQYFKHPGQGLQLL